MNFKKIIIATSCITILSFGSILKVNAATTNQTVVVDVNSIEGAVSQRAAGYLGNDITDSLPSDSVYSSYWRPLNLQLYSWIVPRSSSSGWTFPGLNRARSSNAYYQIKVYGDPGDLSLGLDSPWGRRIAGIVTSATATNYAKIQLDIFNEPDYTGYWPGTGNLSDPRILAAWRIAHDAARSVNPNIQIVGPNVTGGISGSINWLKTVFLPTMKNENRLPDVLSWHEINTPIDQINNRVQDMRNFMAQNGMNVPHISINEYNYQNSHLLPGRGVQFIDQLEKAKVQSASRACWEEVSGGSYDCAPHINGFLDSTGKPRSIWWVYKSYADMMGSVVTSSDTAGFASYATKDEVNGVYKVLVGSISSEPTLLVKLSGLDDVNHSIKIEKIPSTGQTALIAPTLVREYQAGASGSVLEVTIDGVQSQQAFLVTATRIGGATTPTSPTPTPSPLPSSAPLLGDFDGDRDVDINDYNFLKSEYGKTGSSADLDGNGRVNMVDYNILSNNFGR